MKNLVKNKKYTYRLVKKKLRKENELFWELLHQAKANKLNRS